MFRHAAAHLYIEWDLEIRTYGLGIELSPSKALPSGVWDGTAGLYGRWTPNGLSGLLPAWRSLKDTGGAKSIGLNTIESSFSLCGVGSEANGAGGGRGFFGPAERPLMADWPRGGMKRPAELLEARPRGGPWKRGGARGGGVMARRV